MKLFTSLLLVIFGSFPVFAQTDQLVTTEQNKREQRITYKEHKLSYSPNYVQSSWVCYEVNASKNVPTEVKLKLSEDANIDSRPASPKDYKGSGYLEVQFFNSLDASNTPQVQDETMLMSNITPMKETFHQYNWVELEQLIRSWAKETPVQVTTGPFLNETPYATIGKNKVIVPKRFYKVVYMPEKQKAIAFVLKNGTSSGTPKSFAMSVDKLEEACELNFLAGLDDQLEEKIESDAQIDSWNWEKE